MMGRLKSTGCGRDTHSVHVDPDAKATSENRNGDATTGCNNVVCHVRVCVCVCVCVLLVVMIMKSLAMPLASRRRVLLAASPPHRHPTPLTAH